MFWDSRRWSHSWKKECLHNLYRVFIRNIQKEHSVMVNLIVKRKISQVLLCQKTNMSDLWLNDTWDVLSLVLQLSAKSSLCNVGVIFDEGMSLTQHSNKLVRNCFFQLHVQLYHRMNWIQSSTLVSSWLDYFCLPASIRRSWPTYIVSKTLQWGFWPAPTGQLTLLPC